jgi:hypothetical protein
MSTERHIAKKEEMLPELVSFFLGLIAIFLCRAWIQSMQELIWRILTIVCLIAVIFGIYRLIRFLFGNGRALLTEKGIQTGKYLGCRRTAWGSLMQVGAFTFDGCKVIALLSKGGKPFAPKDNKVLFYVKNAGKLIFLRDTKKTRAFVEACYGPLDFDLQEPEKKQ